MIKSIHLKNFFSFRDQTINLQELNVLVGINGVGKSNMIKAIQVLKAVIQEESLPDLLINKWGGLDAVHFLGANGYTELEYEFEHVVLGGYGYKFQESVYYRIKFFKVSSAENYCISEKFYTKNKDGSPCFYYMRMDKGRGFVREGASNDMVKTQYVLDRANESILTQLVDKKSYIQIYTLREALKDISIYNYFDTTINSLIRKPAIAATSARLLSNGSNLPKLLNNIKINYKPCIQKIRLALTSINPNFVDFDFNPLGSGLEMLLEEKGLEKSVHVTHISDGTLRYLCLLSIMYNPNRGKLVCIDEPEVGLHPDMLGELMTAIAETACETQYIICTHSELILNQLDISNVIVLEKDDANSTIAKTFQNEDFIKWARKYATGRLWRNGDLGGNRY